LRRIDPVLTSFTDGVRSGADHFTQLGLPKRFDLDPAELEARYRELSRKLHPDRFAKAEPGERMLSVMASRALNDAYRLLKNPVKRAEYLLSLSGTQISENDKVGQEFLMEILELRETLAEAKASGDAARVAAMGDQVRARRDAAMAAAAGLLTEGSELSAERQQEIKHHLIAVRYFQRFLDEVTGDEDSES
jgi:molecular chaperone HscB